MDRAEVVVDGEWKTVEDKDRKAGCGVIVAEKKVLHVERVEAESKCERATTTRAQTSKQRREEHIKGLHEKLTKAIKHGPDPTHDPKKFYAHCGGILTLMRAIQIADPEYRQTVEVAHRLEEVPLEPEEMREAAKLMAAVKEREKGGQDEARSVDV